MQDKRGCQLRLIWEHFSWEASPPPEVRENRAWVNRERPHVRVL